ncbi:MAG: hypothetical protein ACPIOQ_75420, partial [Promethearchaeia archaeon]
PEPALTAHSLLLAWRERRLGAASNCHLCLGTRQLPHKMRDAFDPLRKKLSKHEREKIRKKTAADGRKLCKQCGQVRGLAYGMVFNSRTPPLPFLFFFVVVALTLAEWPTPLRRCMAFASTLGQCQLKQKLCRFASTTLAKACDPNVVNECEHDRFYNWHCLLSITCITGMTVSPLGRGGGTSGCHLGATEMLELAPQTREESNARTSLLATQAHTLDTEHPVEFHSVYSVIDINKTWHQSHPLTSHADIDCIWTHSAH